MRCTCATGCGSPVSQTCCHRCGTRSFSAGSMVLAPRIGEDFVGWRPPSGVDEALSVVDFSIFPHLDHPILPENTIGHAERWAASLDCPSYAIDDDTAIRVVDGAIDVVSEGHWKRFA